MDDAYGTRGQPASGGSGQGLFGGARRCTERAANLYAERGGEGQNAELRLLKAKVSRLEISIASYKRKWQSTREFAELEDAGRRAHLRMQDPRGPSREPGQTSKRAVRGGFQMNSDGSGSEWTPTCQDEYLEQRRRIEEAQRTRGMSANSAAVLHTFLDERRTNQQWKAERRRERESESRGDGRNEADKAEVPQRVHAGFMITRDLQQARVRGEQTRDRETREHDRGKSGRAANDESLGGFSEAAALLLRVSCYRLNSSFSQDNVTNKTRSPAHPVPELGRYGH